MGRSMSSVSAVVVLMILLPSQVLATGTQNFEFLRVGVVARPAAMGGAFVALSDGVGGMAWNPAGLSRIADSQALAAYMRYPEDVQAGLFALGRTIPGGWSLGLGLKYLTFGSMSRTTVTDPVGQNAGTFSASDVAVAVGAAVQPVDWLRLGVCGTYVSGSIDTYKASGLGLDLGLLLDLPRRDFSVGASLRNLQLSGSSYLTEEVQLPTEGRVGLAYRSASGRERVGLDVVFMGEDGVRLATGAELLLGGAMWVRAGLDQERWDLGRDASGWGSLSGLSWGVGLFWQEWRLDYGVNPFGRLGTTHRLSVKSEM